MQTIVGLHLRVDNRKLSAQFSEEDMLSVYTKPSWEYIGMRIGFNNVSIQTSSQECRDEPKNEHFSALKFQHFCIAAQVLQFAIFQNRVNCRFNDYFRDLLDNDGAKLGFPRPRELRFARSLLIPKRGSVFDYVYIKKNYGSWHRWESLAGSTQLSESIRVYTSPSFLRGLLQSTNVDNDFQKLA